MIAAFGRLDLVVNNAAIFERRPFGELDADIWERTLAVNLTGAFLVAHKAARIMWKAGKGRIINTTEQQRRQVIGRIPAARAGTPDDVVAAVRFLASAPDYMTGTIIAVDGGASLVGR